MKKLYGIVEIEGQKKNVLLAEIEWAYGLGDSTTPIIPIKREEEDYTVFLIGFSYVDYDEYVALFDVYYNGEVFSFFTTFPFNKNVDEIFIYPLAKGGFFDTLHDAKWFSERISHIDDMWAVFRGVAKDENGNYFIRLARDLMENINYNDEWRFVVESWLTDEEAEKSIERCSKELHIPIYDSSTEDWVGNEEEFAKELKQNKDKMLQAMADVESALYNLHLAWDNYNLDELHDNSKYPFSKDLLEQIGDVGEWICDIENQMDIK